jgi:hypothetical protein
MISDDDFGRLLDEADNRGTIDYDDPDSVDRFRDAVEEQFADIDHLPNAIEVGDERGNWIAFYTEWDLWDEVRDAWEDYEKAA